MPELFPGFGEHKLVMIFPPFILLPFTFQFITSLNPSLRSGFYEWIPYKDSFRMPKASPEVVLLIEVADRSKEYNNGAPVQDARYMRAYFP